MIVNICAGCVVFFISDLTFSTASLQAMAPTTQKHLFYLRVNPIRGPHRLSSGWLDSSAVSCAINCLNTYENCRSFMFNSLTMLCTPGSDISKDEPAPIVSEGSLFYVVNCNTSTGFKVISYGSAIACVGVFGPRVNYTSADMSCKNRGAVLMSIKTSDKLMILKQIWNNNITWVGCDDLAHTGIYKWKEDDEALTNETIREVFDHGEPSYIVPGQVCVNLGPGTGKLGDFSCSLRSFYACEIPIL